MYYFQQFPNLYYTFDPNLQQFKVLKNIFTRVDILSSVLTNSLVYYQYQWQDGDTLESIAFKYYGDPLRHWMIIFANTIIDPYFDIPLNADAFSNNIIAKFGSEANAQSTLGVIQQQQTVITTIGQGSNTVIYNATVTPQPFTFNFKTNMVIPQTLPTLDNPVILVSDETVITPDGSIVQTITELMAVSAYDNEVAINEAKRNIVLIDSNYAGQLEAEFQQLLGT
jgi:Base plate wedge protein 53